MADAAIDMLHSRMLPDATLTFVNDIFCEHVGRLRAELEGASLYDAFPDLEKDSLRAHVESLVADKLPLRHECVLPRVNGSHARLEWISFPIVDADDRVIEIHSVGRDISEFKQDKEDLQTRAALLETVTTATRQVLQNQELKSVATTLLRTALEHTQSEYGLFGIVVDGPALRVIAHEGVEWDAIENRQFFEEALVTYEARGFLEFAKAETHFGFGIRDKEVVVSNDPASDSRSGGLPGGHPPLNAYIGVPIRSGGEVVGLLGLANREGGYSSAERSKVETILQLAGLICDRYRATERQNKLEQAQVEAEASIRASNERFEQLANTLEDVFWLYDCAQGRTIYTSPAYERVWGRPLSSLYANANNWLNIIVPEDRDRVANAFLRVDQGRFDETYRIIGKDGAERWVHDRGLPVRDAEGRIVRIAGIAKDITDRKQAEERVLHSERLLRATLDALPSHIAILNDDGRIIAVNEAWKQFADANGLQMPEYGVGTRYLDVCKATEGDHADTADAVARGVEDVLSGRREHFAIEYACETPERKSWYELRVVRFVAHDHVLAVSIHLDISDRKLAEERAYRQQVELAHMGRVSILGEIAAGIAHELNQPLASIMNYAQGGMDRIDDATLTGESSKETFRRIFELARKSGDIIRRIRGLSRKGDSRQSTADINQLVNETLEMLKYEMVVSDVRLKLQLSDSLPLIHVDSVQTQQVLMNLLLNALGAVKSSPVTPKIVGVTTRKRDGWIEISVSDTGPGFGDLAAEQLFEPFFSTKSGGLGLGLAISRTIINQHRGKLWAERDGDETVFRFSLPLRGEAYDQPVDRQSFAEDSSQNV